MYVAFSVVMISTIFIIHISNISYILQCWPWLANPVSLIYLYKNKLVLHETLCYTDIYRALSFG